jgi:MerR family mercuric resistance operon transcriptional regulator
MPSNGLAMHIGDVSKQTNLSVDTIRFYERNALLPAAPRTAGRFRLYTNSDVTRLRFVRKMQGLGFSLREVRQIMDLRENRLDACKAVSELVKIKLEEVHAKIRDLTNLEHELARGLRKCNAELKQRQGGSPRICPVLALSDDKGGRRC